MKIFIKNMVSLRCKIIVAEALQRLGIHFVQVEMGEIEILQQLSKEEYRLIKDTLSLFGLAVIDDNKLKITEKIKHIIIELVHHSEEQLNVNFSSHLSQKLQYDYTYLANIFSDTEGMTIEKFMICHKIERVKEMLAHGEMSLTEIAEKLHYSSVSHVSNQFKKVTGLTPSLYKQRKLAHRATLEKACGT
ncbi:MAG: helix-turn-helix transcriptional regulator [Gloeobacteraceae cyanobacterium ES-bin-316]|nr:helix-turn-helix transcriptional regulator [Ferruginibacter sp.]